MTGPHDSVIGVEADLAIRRMRTGMPVRFRPAEGGVRLQGHVLDCDREGRATAIEPLRVDIEDNAFEAYASCGRTETDRKSTRLNSSHGYISYAVFCLQ